MKKSTIIYGLLIILITGTASAVNIGVSPASLTFDNMIPGGYSETTLFISTSGDDRLQIGFGISGPIKDWISFNETDFILEPRSTKTVVVYARPPLDAAGGNYSGDIYMRASRYGGVESGGTGLGVSGGISVGVTITLTGIRIENYKLVGVSVKDTEIGFPVRFTVDISNIGNIRTKPGIHIEIYDKNEKNMLISSDYADTEILPTKTESVNVEVPLTDFKVGNYIGKIQVKEDKQKVIFNVLERGTLALKGILKQIRLNKIWVETGETSKVEAVFENKGDLLIEGAKLKVEAYLIDEKYGTEKLMKTFESDSLNVPIGQEITLSSYFTPQQEGRYRMTGYITYSGKNTPPKDTILNVLAKPTNYLPYIIIIAIILAALIVYLTRKGEDGRTRRFKKIWSDYLSLK